MESPTSHSPPGSTTPSRSTSGGARAPSGAERSPGAGVASTTVDYWEAIATLPAEGLSGYGYPAPTTQDSMAGSNPYAAFFVTALAEYPPQFFESNVDSGYSVDNLAPPSPTP